MSKVRYKHFIWILAVSAALFSGCVSRKGAEYEIVYPSGYARDPYTWDKILPVEGTSFQLESRKSENFGKNRSYDLHILDENGAVLYEYPEMGAGIVRGEAGEAKDTIWVSNETWSIPHYNGYINGCLDKSTLLLLNMQSGDILFRATAEANQLYLTTIGDHCYFYFPGRKERQNAEIYYRNFSDWSEKHTVYTFDYIMEPEIETKQPADIRVRFLLGSDQFKVVWTACEPIGESMDYVEKKVYEITINSDSFTSI